ncbi:hypothetical protein E2562_003096 [Oryza meyeriana var. granulata]|uniref:Uncharacterized protein n=1 Tax=Oryza meyeriana var. granulata TaxID=110450 RepID=A0A6G1EA37_9ORYZ|nr:hypothetical protein E2562_003096 [Oryza meyeriana var. granulata]
MSTLSLEHYVRKSNLFDNEEYVGVNDEHLYVPPPAQPDQPAKNPDTTPSTTEQTSQPAATGVEAPEAQVKKNPNKGAKDAKQKLEEQYEIKLKYSKAWARMKLALEQIHGFGK